MPDHTRNRTRAHHSLIAAGALACVAIILFGVHQLVTFGGRDPAAGAPSTTPAPVASRSVATAGDRAAGDRAAGDRAAGGGVEKDPSRDRVAADRSPDSAGPDMTHDGDSSDVPDPAVATSASIVPATAEQAMAATRFLDAFVAQHAANDSEQLLARLHPAISAAFGEAACRDYVGLTAGSVKGVRVTDVIGMTTFTLDTPTGPIEFPGAIAVDAELTYFDGEVATARIHLPHHDGAVFWLTTCGN
jgi:hypothetical protein